MPTMSAKNDTFPHLVVYTFKPQPLQPFPRTRNSRVSRRKYLVHPRPIHRFKQAQRVPVNARRREALALDEARPPAIVFVHQHETHRHQTAIPPTCPAQKPGGVRRDIDTPFRKVRRLEVFVGNHPVCSFVSIWGTMPSKAAGPALGIEMHTLGSRVDAPLKGLFTSSVIGTSAAS